MSKNSTYYLEIIGKLEKLCRKKYRSHLFTGVQLLLFIILFILTIFSLVELVTHLNSSLRTFLFFFALFVISGVLLYLVLSLLYFITKNFTSVTLPFLGHLIGAISLWLICFFSMRVFKKENYQNTYLIYPK